MVQNSLTLGLLFPVIRISAAPIIGARTAIKGRAESVISF